MTQQQKRILLAWVLLDIAVIVWLGSFIARSVLTPTTETIKPFLGYTPPTPCEQVILDTLPATAHPVINWATQALHIRLEITYRASTPPLESTQMLWTMLDSLNPVVTMGCTLPPSLTLTLVTHGETQTIQHIVRLPGDQVMAWIQGNLTEDTLTAQAIYRQFDDSVKRQPLSTLHGPR
ncbi:MAG: hypothetical protein JXA33_07760 [Anaerolineae bacterium]|nr:hypothetical protein [Anaerolineae bacterium]